MAHFSVSYSQTSKWQLLSTRPVLTQPQNGTLLSILFSSLKMATSQHPHCTHKASKRHTSQYPILKPQNGNFSAPALYSHSLKTAHFSVPCSQASKWHTSQYPVLKPQNGNLSAPVLYSHSLKTAHFSVPCSQASKWHTFQYLVLKPQNGNFSAPVLYSHSLKTAYFSVPCSQASKWHTSQYPILKPQNDNFSAPALYSNSLKTAHFSVPCSQASKWQLLSTRPVLTQPQNGTLLSILFSNLKLTTTNQFPSSLLVFSSHQLIPLFAQQFCSDLSSLKPSSPYSSSSLWWNRPVGNARRQGRVRQPAPADSACQSHRL